MRRPNLTPDGMDRIGPFHPYLVYAAVLLLNLLIVAAVLVALTAVIDWTEDLIWPGGPEMLPF